MSAELDPNLITVPFNVIGKEQQDAASARVEASGEITSVDEEAQRIAQNRHLASLAMFEAASEHAVNTARLSRGDTPE